MKIQYFADTDTVYVLLNDNVIAETHDLDENTLLDVDAKGSLVGITIGHAKERADITNFVFRQITAPLAT